MGAGEKGGEDRGWVKEKSNPHGDPRFSNICMEFLAFRVLLQKVRQFLRARGLLSVRKKNEIISSYQPYQKGPLTQSGFQLLALL